MGWQPYWHKIAMLRAACRHFRNATGFVWVDDDVVLTNHGGTDMIQEALRLHGASVLVTRDPSRAATLNTGIMIVRNDQRGREVLDELWRRATARRADGISLAHDSQAKCLHEQQALQEMVWSGDWQHHIAVTEQRGGAQEGLGGGGFNLNTVTRQSEAQPSWPGCHRHPGEPHLARMRELFFVRCGSSCGGRTSMPSVPSTRASTRTRTAVVGFKETLRATARG